LQVLDLACNAIVDLFESPPLRGTRRAAEIVGLQTVDHFVEREPEILEPANEAEPGYGFFAEHAIPGGRAVSGRQHTTTLVVADRVDRHAGALCHLTDLQLVTRVSRNPSLTLESRQGFRVVVVSSSAKSFGIHATPDAAIACDMTDAPDTPDDRIAEYGRLFAHALVRRERTEAGVVFTFAAKPGIRDWIADLVRREATCCPFLSYEVDIRGDHVVWTTSSEAGPDPQAMLDAFYAGPEQFGDGFDGLLARLAQSDVHVVADGPARFVIAESAQ
jgi:hypothetical protein